MAMNMTGIVGARKKKDDLPRFPLLVPSLEFVLCVKYTLLMSVREQEEREKKMIS